MKHSFPAYLASLEGLSRAASSAHTASADAQRKQVDDLRILAEDHKGETTRIESRIETATDRYRGAAAALREPPVAQLNLHLPERIRPAENHSPEASSSAERTQERAARALAQVSADYRSAFASHQNAAASAADALAARRAALANRPPASPWWQTRQVAIVAAVVLIIVVVLTAILVT